MRTRNILVIISVLVATSFFFASCKKKEENSYPMSGDYYLKVKIDGIEYSFNNSVFVNASSLKVGLIAISPNDGFGKNMAIVVTSKDPKVTGTFTEEFTAVFTEDGRTGAWDADGNSRTITILKNTDVYIEGTFSFSGYDLVSKTTKQFSEGSFRAKK